MKHCSTLAEKHLDVRQQDLDVLWKNNNNNNKKPVKGCEKSTAMHQNLNSAVTAEGTCFAAWEHGHLAINSQLYKEQECQGSSP